MNFSRIFTIASLTLMLWIIVIHEGRASIHLTPLIKNSIPDGGTDSDSPSGTSSGGTRAPCGDSDIDIVPLGVGRTTAAHPTFWFYIAANLDFVESSEFSLQNQEGDDVYHAVVSISSPSAFIGVRLPESVSPLEVDRTYNWSFLLECQSRSNEPAPLEAVGAVQRIESSQASSGVAVINGSPDLYSVTDLRSIRQASRSWRELLQSINQQTNIPLEQLEDATILISDPVE